MEKPNLNISISFFLIIQITFSALIIYLSRIGLDNELNSIIRAVGLGYFIVLFPFAFNNFYNLKYKKVLNIPILSLTVIFFTCFLGLINNYFIFRLNQIYFLLGFLLLFYYLFYNIKNIKINKKNLFLLFFSIIFSFFITSVYYGNQYTHPLMVEKIINGSWAHRDSLYHASIAGIFKTYLYVGTGIDGFVPHYYHTLSHSLFALISNVIKVNTLDFYSIFFPILITPIFLMFFLYSVLEVSKFFGKKNHFKILEEKSIFLWTCLYIFFALPINSNILPEKYQYLQSQSYAVALAIFFITVNIFFYYINNQLFILNKKRLDLSFYFYPIIILILAACSSYSKVSFLYLFTVIFFYFFLRLKLFKIKFFLLLLAFWLLFVILLYFNVLNFFDGRDIFIENTYSIDAAYDYNYSFFDEFFFVYLSIIYLILKLLSLKILNPKLLYQNILDKKIYDIELVIILIFAFYIVPYQYFKGIQLYLSIILIIAHINFFWKTFIKK